MSGLDVYNFLHMVSSAGGTNSYTACLGEEIDDLMQVDEVAEYSLSPDYGIGLDMPVFEDAVDFENNLDCQPAVSNWKKVMPSKKVSNVGWDALSAWNKNAEDGDKFAASATSSKKQSDWCDWGTSKFKSQDVVSPKSDETCIKEQTELSGWGMKKSATQYVLPIEEKTFKSNGWDARTSWGTMDKESEKTDASDALPWSGWGTKDSILTKTLDETSKSSGWGNVSSWGKNIVAVHEFGFSGNDTQLDQGREESEWNNKASQENPVQLTSSWNNKVTEEKAVQLTSGWDKKATQEKLVQSTSGWVSSTAAGWTKDESPITNSSLDQQKSPECSQGWGSLNESNQPASSSGWDMPHGEGNTQSEKQHKWGQSRGSRLWALDASKKNRPVKPA